MKNNVSMSQVSSGVRSFVQGELLPHLPTDGWQGFGVGFVSAITMQKVDGIIQRLMQHPVVAMLDVVDSDGMVDIDTVYEAAQQAMPDSGISLSLLGQKITFHQNDLRKLYDHIIRQ